MGGGGRDLLYLGRHCQFDECHQLDFLPFECDGCRKVFCLEHRNYRSHKCPRQEYNNRVVLVCDVCSTSIEIKSEKKTDDVGNDKGDEPDIKALMEKHKASRSCDPKLKQKPRCPIRGCKEVLTFSNSIFCKSCEKKTCLKHRFPMDHGCTSGQNVNVVNSLRVLPSLIMKNGREYSRPGSRASATYVEVK